MLKINYYYLTNNHVHDYPFSNRKTSIIYLSNFLMVYKNEFSK